MTLARSRPLAGGGGFPLHPHSDGAAAPSDDVTLLGPALLAEAAPFTTAPELDPSTPPEAGVSLGEQVRRALPELPGLGVLSRRRMARHPEAPAPEPTDAASAEAEPGLTIDELAAESGVPSRTIRFYQSKGVLPAPTMRGRVAFYGPSHAQRLELIAQLQDRGLKIDAIRDLTQRIDKGELDVGEWLGLESELTAPWAHDTPRTLTEAELTELLGQKRPGQLAELVRLGVVERRGDVYLVGSPALLNVGVKLGQAGIDLATAVGAQLILRKYLARAAQELVDHFLAAASRGDLSLEKESDLARIFEALRPTGTEAVRVVFGQEMERVLRTLATSGKAHQLPRARKRR